MSTKITSLEAAKILGISVRRVRQLSEELGAERYSERVILFDRERIEQEAKKPRPRPGPKRKKA